MNPIKRFQYRLQKRVEAAFKKKGADPFFSLETILRLLSVLYGGVVVIRARLYAKGLLKSHRLPCRVVSIGNIVAGGTGKTPMTVFVAGRLRDLGLRVVVVNRGYRGRMEKTGGVVSDGTTVFKNARDAGDEAYLMARLLKGVPVVVGRDRYRVGMAAVRRFHPDVIVMDDAFQHLRLKRDLDLVLMDSRSPWANGCLLPRGPLREPPSCLRRAQAIVLTRSTGNGAESSIHPRTRRLPLFHAAHTSVIRYAPRSAGSVPAEERAVAPLLSGRTILAFAGIADNAQFFSALEQCCCTVLRRFAFDDHHRYTDGDVHTLLRTFHDCSADYMVTTLKDFVKLEDDIDPSIIIAVDVKIDLLGDEDRFSRFLEIELGLLPPAT